MRRVARTPQAILRISRRRENVRRTPVPKKLLKLQRGPRCAARGWCGSPSTSRYSRRRLAADAPAGVLEYSSPVDTLRTRPHGLHERLLPSRTQHSTNRRLEQNKPPNNLLNKFRVPPRRRSSPRSLHHVLGPAHASDRHQPAHAFPAGCEGTQRPDPARLRQPSHTPTRPSIRGALTRSCTLGCAQHRPLPSPPSRFSNSGFVYLSQIRATPVKGDLAVGSPSNPGGEP